MKKEDLEVLRKYLGDFIVFHLDKEDLFHYSDELLTVLNLVKDEIEFYGTNI